MTDSDIKSYLDKLIKENYRVESDKGILNDFNFPSKYRYRNAKISDSPKYINKESTYGLKFGLNITYWFIILICIMTSSKIFYDFINKSHSNNLGVIIILIFFLICIIYFGYNLLFNYPIIEIKKDRLIYRKKESILWKNVATVGIIRKFSTNPPSECKIVIGTKEKQLKEIDVTLIDKNIQTLIDIIFKNVA